MRSIVIDCSRKEEQVDPISSVLVGDRRSLTPEDWDLLISTDEGAFNSASKETRDRQESKYDKTLQEQLDLYVRPENQLPKGSTF